MTQNLHVCVFYYLPEAVYEVISGRNVKTIEGYLLVKFEGARSNNLRDIKKNHFVTADAAAEANVDDSIKRKRIRVLLKND